MTTVITRYFDSAAQARLVKQELYYRRRFPLNILSLYEKAEGLGAALAEAHVDAAAIRAYEERMATGGAVLLVKAGYKPLGVAQITRDVTAEMGAADLTGIEEEVWIKDVLTKGPSILTDHPLMLTRRRDPDSTDYFMADWPIGHISRRKPFDDFAFPRHSRMADFPIPLLIDLKPYTKSIFPRHARMADWPIPLLSKRKPYTGSIIGRHARMASFPIPLISRRKPYRGTIIGKHTRMANWPFPLLINGKMGQNALMPGGPRMANFPIRLISRRKPFTGSVIGRHARMASFPIPLLSKRKPYTGSIIPRHGHMAAFPWPLIIERSGSAAKGRDTGFSFSKMMGWPTIQRR